MSKRKKKEDACAPKGRKVTKKKCVFCLFCGSAGLKVGSLKRWCGTIAIWAHMRSKIARHCGEKHIQMSKNCTPLWSEAHCSKNARRCSAKHIWNSKSPQHATFGTLLDVEMLKK